jgi:hypothetical protein
MTTQTRRDATDDDADDDAATQATGDDADDDNAAVDVSAATKMMR